MSASAERRRRVPEHLFAPGRPGGELVQTHVSVIAFDDEVAHKRKKPVHFGFVDLSTPAQRAQACRQEVELNRRFSPDVYLGVEDVVDEQGRVVDQAVLMRRMPAARRLSTLVQADADVTECLRGIARQLAAYHAQARADEQVASVGTADAVRGRWRDNIDELAPFVPSALDHESVTEADRLAQRYLRGRAELLRRRIADGRVVDGHGDLLADDIYCLQEGPRLLDALEFDERLRWGDVLSDVGFLAMDLEHLGREDLAGELMRWYREYSAERHPSSLEHHYVAYRALVRAKVSCLKGTDTDRAEAVGYLDQCRRHLAAAQVRLVLVGGLPGTGKSNLATAVAERLGAVVLRSDEVRKELAGLDPLTPAPAGFGEGIYTTAATETAYQGLMQRAAALLALGETVVLDASFSDARWRAVALAMAERLAADCTEVRCVLPASLAADRMRQRARRGGDVSDATPEVAARMAGDAAPWPTALEVHTDTPVDQVLSGLLANLTGLGPCPRSHGR
ncbi:MAG: AAA family ATPase [Dermatophilaceae bacterium]